MPRSASTIQSLTRPPFGDFAGYLGPRTGSDDFVELESTSEVLGRVAERSVKRASFWLLGGEYGSGKTWVLSWLIRNGAARLEARTQKHWATVGFTLRVSNAPDRSFYEGFFSGAATERTRILADLIERVGPLASGVKDRIFRAVVSQPSYWSVLEGRSRSFPKRPGGTPVPTWSVPKNRDDLFMSFLRHLKTAGVDRLLITVDEFEVSVLTSGPSGLKRLSHFLRSLYDLLDSSENIPNVQVILSATADVVKRLSPDRSARPVEKVRDVSSLVTALRERLDEYYLMPELSEGDALKVADYRIRRSRATATPTRPFVPFDEDAVKMAYGACARILRRFCVLLEAMYEEALAKKAPAVTEEIARAVIRRRADS